MRTEDIHHAIRILKREVKAWPIPAVGQYVETAFTVLISCLLSLRTQDRTTLAASERLFALAASPERMLDIPSSVIEKAIYPVSFYRVKARTILEICRQLLARFEGRVPSRMEDLLALPGVGRKTANIVVTLAYRKAGIAVDTHVHRITNRWGYVKTRTPEKTEKALRNKLPRRYWIVLNDLLVAYGQNVCKPVSPFCSRCKMSRFCDRVGVTRSR